jgi:uncharacterized protein (TIGR03437 family)
VTAPASANKSVKVDVNLTVQPGAAKVVSVWPQKIVAGAPDTTVTITGSNFYTGTTVSAGQSAPKTTILGSTALTAVLPASLLATAGTITLAAANPDPGGGTTGTVTFTVAATGPQIASVVNSASYATGPVAPGEVVTIFGSGLGPDTLAVFTAVNNVIPTDLDSTRVTFGTTAAPVIYTSATQVAAVAPFGLDTTAPVTLKVAYNSVDSALLPVLTAAAAPGIFTFTGTGAGQAAALNYDETKKEYSINSDTTPATKGSILIFYATGTGKPAQPPADGTIPQQASTTNEANISAQIGGVDATVIYAGAAPGLVAGMMQVNVRVPDTVTTNKAATLTLKSGAIASPAGVTVSVK